MGGSANSLKPRYAAWQRALRHLTGVCFAGHAPFEPAHAAQIIVELLPLPEDSLQPWQPSPPEEQLQQSPPPLPPHAALDPSIEAPAEGVLLRTEPLAVGATHPAWVIDAADLMPPRAGALRGVVLVLRQLAPRRVAAAGEPSRVVWRQEVRFSALVHLHSDAATLAAALPATSGALLLTFADGVCVTPDVLESIRACGQVVLEPSAPLHARGGGGEAAPATAAGDAEEPQQPQQPQQVSQEDPQEHQQPSAAPPFASQEALVEEALRLMGAVDEARRAGAAACEALGRRLERRAEDAQRRGSLHRHAAHLASPARRASASAPASPRLKRRRPPRARHC